jgi:lipopolysaccharide export system protein LptA
MPADFPMVPADRSALRTLALAFVCCVSGVTLSSAQGLSLGGVSEDRPVEVSADSGIEWQQDAKVYIARGNAIAKRGTTEVHADTLTAHYRPSKGAGGETEVYRLDADGHVMIKSPTQTVVGDQAVYDVDQQIGIVTGKALKLTTPSDVVTARDSFEWYDAKQIAVARGDAIAVRDTKRLRGDVLTAHMTKDKPKLGENQPAEAKTSKAVPAAANAKTGAKAGPLGDGDEGSRISRIDAQGNVLVSTPTDIGRGDYGVYNADTGIVTLLGNVTITRGPNAIKGEYAVVDLNNNISRMMPGPSAPGTPTARVEGLFVRQDQGAPSGRATNTNAAPNTSGAQKQ